MKAALEAIRAAAHQQLTEAKSLKELDDLRVKFLGKKGELTAILKRMGGLSAEERPVVGQLANQIRESVEGFRPGPRPPSPRLPGAGRGKGDLFGHGLRCGGRPRGGNRLLQL